MDGRVQLPVIKYLQERFGVDYVDVISEPGPNKILASSSDLATIESIYKRLEISVDHHNSIGIAIVGHHGCAGNPSCESDQKEHTFSAIKRISSKYQSLPVIGLWVDENWEVSELR
jgi:hypothetical protein